MQGLLFWWWLSGRWVVAFVMFELAGRRRASLRGRLRTVSLFSWSVEQNARDTQMTTRVTEGARRERHPNYFLLGLPPSLLASRVSRLASRVSRLASRVSRLASRVSLLASRASRLVSRVLRLAASPLNARARALPFLNLKKRRDCSQSTWEVTRERHANGDASVRGEDWKGTFDKIPFLHHKLRTSVIVRRASR